MFFFFRSMRLALEAGFMTIIVSFMFHRSIRSNGLLRTLIKTPDSDSYSALATIKARLLDIPSAGVINWLLFDLWINQILRNASTLEPCVLLINGS